MRISRKLAEEELNKKNAEARKLLDDKDKLEEFLSRMEEKLASIKVLNNSLGYLPTMIRMVRSYVNKEYREIPTRSIVALISALMYVMSPIDLIPDIFPGVGYLDDIVVVDVCLRLVKKDLDAYRKWLSEKNIPQGETTASGENSDSLELEGTTCGKKSYNVDYRGQKDMFSGAQNSYKEGDMVELSYGLVATDTDYSFRVDGQAVNAHWDGEKGYIIKFTMPDHDIEVYCNQRNSR